MFGDERGFFLESYNQRAFDDATGHDVEFVQDNHSRSARGVLRGLHYQIRAAAGQAGARASRGEVFDVAVDMRRSSPTFGSWVGVELDAATTSACSGFRPGFAHGFLVLSEQRRRSSTRPPTTTRRSTSARIAWNDPALGIALAARRLAHRQRKGPARQRLPLGRLLRLRILLTGRNGQVGWELERALPALGEVVATDRSTLDLGDADAIRRVVREARPDLIVNAAAYTAVDKAESERDLATRSTRVAPGILAEEAKRWARCSCTTRPIMSSTA